MSIDPARIRYLREADAFMGNLAEDRIEQVGETLSRFRKDYRVIDAFQGIKTADRMTAG
jgi:hypothetical protein